MAFKPLIKPSDAAVWQRAAGRRAGFKKEFQADAIIGFDRGDNAVEFRFTITPQDVEKSEIVLSIGRDDFHLLFDAMSKASGSAR
ncbi:MAG: hypothetical protein OXC14_02665 [Rhodospirillaceae bacterium]|nr:hypothetical protein [Rhodospirillaceae bacterium]